MSKGKWFQTVVVGLIVLWLLRFPPTRFIILFLLPLGRGWDDLAAWIIIGVVIVVLVVKNLRYGKSFRQRKSQIRNFFKD